MNRITFFGVVALAATVRAEMPWFKAGFGEYAPGQELSDLGAVGGHWTVAQGATATNAPTDGFGAIVLDPNLDGDGVAFTLDVSAGSGSCCVDVRVRCGALMDFGGTSPEGVMAFTFVDGADGRVVDFAGIVAGRWVRLTAQDMTFATDAWYDIRTETRDFGGLRYCGFSVKKGEGFVQLANASGAKWFPLSPDAPAVTAVAFVGSGAFSDISGLLDTSAAEPVTAEWVGGAAGDWNAAENWSFARTPDAGDTVRIAGSATLTNGEETATLAGALVRIGEDDVWELLSGRVVADAVTLDASRPRAGKALSVEASPFHGLRPEVTAKWYRSPSPVSRTYAQFADATKFIPAEADYERWFRCEAFDADGTKRIEKEFLFSRLPVLYLTTNDGKTPTAEKEEHKGRLVAQGNDAHKGGADMYDGAMTIKVRGNSTSSYPKKPWKLKLDSTAKMFGLGSKKNKHWVLLANYNDESTMRNKLAADFANEIGSLGMESTWVECVLNGEWQGLYQFGEHIRIAEDRVNVFNWEDEAKDRGESDKNFSWVDPAKDDITGGYLFESSEEYDERTRFTVTSGNLTLKTMLNSPEYLYTSQSMVDWCKGYLQKFCDATTSADGYAQGLHYSQYADLDSMATYFLVMEMFGNDDAVYKSRYFYKDCGKPIVFGPVWDFDWGVGNDVVLSSCEPAGWKVARGHSASFFREWADDPWFCTRIRTLYWSRARAVLARMTAVGGEMDVYKAQLAEAGAANDAKWRRKRGFATDVERLRGYLTQRLAWLDAQFADVPTLMASFRSSGSTRPYDASPATLPIAFANAPQGCLWEGQDLKLSFAVGGDGVATVGVYANGLKVGEPVAPAGGRLDVTIPGAMLTAAKGEPNCVSLVAFDSGAAATSRNYALVTLTDWDDAKDATAPTTDATGEEVPSVPFRWIRDAAAAKVPSLATATAERDFADALLATPSPWGKSTPLWQDYVAGTDPDPVGSNATFRITSLAVTNGVPYVTYAPDLGEKRTYTTFGKTNLSDRVWLTPVPDGARFFRVKVDLPPR